jgi:cell division protein ZapE
MEAYITPNDAKSSSKLELDFESLTIGAQPRPMGLDVNGRVVEIPRTAEGVAIMDFADMCAKPLGPGDYLAVARRFHTVILKDIPKLGPHNRDVAKRFVTLVDALYEAKTNLICSAAVTPYELYTEGDGAFEFERTVSRLMEMQSIDYISLPHEDEGARGVG